MEEELRELVFSSCISLFVAPTLVKELFLIEPFDTTS
jgi:hypothetical protein